MGWVGNAEVVLYQGGEGGREMPVVYLGSLGHPRLWDMGWYGGDRR